MTGDWWKKESTLSAFPPRQEICLLIAALVCVALSATAHSSPNVDRIVIEKGKRTLSLMHESKVVKSYKVALGGKPEGPKERTGDHKTPEGVYTVDAKKPNSQFHKALHLSYPNAADRERARKLGVNPGGDIEIHGLGSRWGWVGAVHRATDWTDGCVAVTNEEIDEIYPLIQVGTPVEIKP